MTQGPTVDPSHALASIVALMKEHELTELEFHENGMPKIIKREPDVVIEPPPIAKGPQDPTPTGGTVGNALAFLAERKSLKKAGQDGG